MERTLHLDSAREVTGAHRPARRMAARYEEAFHVRLTQRDTWLKVEARRRRIERFCHFFDTLRVARDRGVTLRDAGLTFALRAYADGREEDLARLYSARIDVAPGKPALFARTFGQTALPGSHQAPTTSYSASAPLARARPTWPWPWPSASLLKGEVSRIILTRPAVEAGENLGYLPGDLQQKVLPYLRPLYDALYDMMDADMIERHSERGVIEIAPLAYMRGRTLNHAFVILDEAQNTTPEQMLMFLTRMGFDSKCVITGDLTQVDLPPNKTSGLLEAQRTLPNVDGIAIMELTDADVVRHPLVQKIIQAYRAGRAT
jgi:phosphate starvation-inducible PhoH-like protein